jgi:hypothetical protein
MMLIGVFIPDGKSLLNDFTLENYGLVPLVMHV